MSHKGLWCSLFTTVTAITGGGLVATGLFSQSASKQFSNQALDLLQTFLDNNFNISGTFSMDITLPNSNVQIHIVAENLNLTMHLYLIETLIQQSKSMITLLENACKAAIWQSGIQNIVNVLLLAAAVGGIAFAYKYFTQIEAKEERLLSNC